MISPVMCDRHPSVAILDGRGYLGPCYECEHAERELKRLMRADSKRDNPRWWRYFNRTIT